MSKNTSRSPRTRLALALGATVAVLAAGCGSSTSSGPPSSGGTSSQPSATTTTGPATAGGPTADSASPSSPSSPSSTATTAAPPLGSPVNQPLWPFGTLAQAQAWEQSYTSGGHQPWHLDAGQTALSFTRGYLGFTGIDKVVASTVSGPDAHVAVGFATPADPPGTATAAVLHLVRYGPGPDAPWEVVGSADTSLRLITPAYGATVTSPVAVGGTITGVDEAIRVQIRQPSSAVPLGRSGPTAAGGTNSPWGVRVTFAGAVDPVLTIVAATGGHLTAVERFAVTAIHAK